MFRDLENALELLVQRIGVSMADIKFPRGDLASLSIGALIPTK